MQPGEQIHSEENRPSIELVGITSLHRNKKDSFASRSRSLEEHEPLQRKHCKLQQTRSLRASIAVSLTAPGEEQERSSSSSGSYVTAKLAKTTTSQQLISSSSSNATTDKQQLYTARTTLTSQTSSSSSWSPTFRTAPNYLSPEHNSNSSEMVSFSVEDSHQGCELGAHLSASNRTITQEVDGPTTAPSPEDDDDQQMITGDEELSSDRRAHKLNMKMNKQQTSQANSNQLDENSSSGEPDDEQLRRILMCKRLSEGCNRYNPANFVNRKNSLHMIGEELAPVTEGEAMRHFPYPPAGAMADSAASSSSSGSLRGATGRPITTALVGGHFNKRNSQDDNANTSCSSSTSLDGGGGPRSPGRRRSSTVSQCSSVLSEGARQQLNFDLSPDLAPDSSLLEANAISPTDLDDRPASPEPSSLSCADDVALDSSLDMRPISRMSTSACCADDLILMAANYSPDSTLGDSNAASLCPQHQQQHEYHQSPVDFQGSSTNEQASESSRNDHLERLISHVSTVKVSQPGEQEPQQETKTTHKRAHTDDQPQQQRSKWSPKADHHLAH